MAFKKLVLLLLALTVLSAGAKAQPAPGGPPAVGVVRAEKQQITQSNEFVGRIQLGQSTPTTAVIVSGVRDGELVISEGVQRVRPGEVVSPGPASPPPSAAGG